MDINPHIMHALLLFMIIAAVIAVELTELLSAVIAVGAVGLGLAVFFLFLGAPELAIIQLIVEILSLVIFIRATDIKGDVKRTGRVIVAPAAFAVFAAAFLAVTWRALGQLPAFGSPLMKVSGAYADNAMKGLTEPNLVSAIMFRYRAFDTLGQLVVFFTAAVCVFAIMRKSGRTGR